jgi:hypothetical protein
MTQKPMDDSKAVVTPRNLSVLSYANGFTLWHYRAFERTLAEVNEPEFFKPARDMLGIGDMILVSARDGCGILCVVPDSKTATLV